MAIFGSIERLQRRLETSVRETERIIGHLATQTTDIMRRVFGPEGFSAEATSTTPLLRTGRMLGSQPLPRPRVVSILPLTFTDAGHNSPMIVATLARSDTFLNEGASTRRFAITQSGLALAHNGLLEPHLGYYPHHTPSADYSRKGARLAYANTYIQALGVAGVVVAAVRAAAEVNGGNIIGPLGVGDATDMADTWRRQVGAEIPRTDFWLAPPLAPGLGELLQTS